MELPVARVLRRDETRVFVLCPYCGDAHKHEMVAAGDVRGSDCDRVGLSGDYRIGELVPVKELALAIGQRNKNIRRKEAGRARAKGACKE